MIFMSTNHDGNGAGHVLSFPTLYCKDAKHCVAYMAKYLTMEYSPIIYSSFSTSAVAIAESMESQQAYLCK